MPEASTKGQRISTPDAADIASAFIDTNENATFGLLSTPPDTLVVFAPTGSAVFDRFQGTTSGLDDGTLLTGPLNAHNAAALRRELSWLQPIPLGLQTSAGFGDRLGLATSGHIGAMRMAGHNIAPFYAQQSIREMERTDRSAQEVVDDAMWAVFAGNWRGGYGADADHLKTTDDIDRCVAAGYTFFTIDPSDHVSNPPSSTEPGDLARQYQALPWPDLADTADGTLSRYAGEVYDIEGHRIAFGDVAVMRAALKYRRALAHVHHMTAHLAAALPSQAYEVEISVDETEDPTSAVEHVYIASELQRLGVRWVSLAPRFTGRFEKGIEYIGGVDTFARDFAVHAAIARHFGPYKLSLHSGSDKFSIYGEAARLTRGGVHLKTAGTSFLEALRVVATHDPVLFRRLYGIACDRFEIDKASYHVSADLARAPQPNDVAVADLPRLLDQPDARQILHVTFGSLLTSRDRATEESFGEEIKNVLRTHPRAYVEFLERHFVRHLQPFQRYASNKS